MISGIKNKKNIKKIFIYIKNCCYSIFNIDIILLNRLIKF